MYHYLHPLAGSLQIPVLFTLFGVVTSYISTFAAYSYTRRVLPFNCSMMFAEQKGQLSESDQRAHSDWMYGAEIVC